MILGVLLDAQVVVDGIVNGLVYGLVGMGVVLVYRSTRVINFAVAAMGLPSAGLMALLVLRYHFAYWLALPIALVVGLAFGAASELLVVRRLFDAPRVILLVATIGLAQLALAVTMALPDVTETGAEFPLAMGSSVHLGSSIELSGSELLIVIVAPLVAVALGWSMSRTAFGRAVAAAADNPDLARLSGISPKVASTIVWTIAGGVSAVALILIAGRAGGVNQVATLGPATLTRALIVAVIAGMASFPRALGAGIAVGVAEAIVGFNNPTDPGRFETYLFVLVLVAVFWQARRERAGGGDAATTYSFTPHAKSIPEVLQGRWWVRHHGRIIFVVAVVSGVVAPLIATQPTRAYLYASILCFALVALSVSVVTGWSGQLSLGQMAFAGFAALGTATLAHGMSFDVGSSRVTLEAMPVLVAVLIASALAAGVAVVIGIGALRIRGLLLGVSTFVFAYAAQQSLFSSALLTGGQTPPVGVPRGTFFGVSLDSQRAFYWFVLAVVALVVSVVARLRRRAPGRNMVAVRDNPSASAAYTLSETRTKLAGFALAGGIAGLGGALLGVLNQSVDTTQVFTVTDSLDVVAIAVIGGLGSVAGPIVGALWVKGLPAFFPGNELVPLFASSIGLLLLLLYFPGGLVQIGYWLRDGLFAWVARRVPERSVARPDRVPARRRSPETVVAEDRPAVAAHDIVVRFGGVRAVDGASLEVAAGEVVGLIGTNGAGKSTLLNAIGGYVPASGTVEVHGRDVSGLAPHRRAGHGLGRTFQAARLFPELTVRESVAVALEGRGHTSLVGTAVAWPPTGRRERARMSEAVDIIDFVGLGRFADHLVAHLSTGTRRIVELAALIALDAKVLCLDEPTAGVAQRETEAFGPLLSAIRAELDASLLIVEHDMPLIMSLCDRVYCLEAGRVIAQGVPDAVRSDPVVIASYLGTDERAIARSDTGRSRDHGGRVGEPGRTGSSESR